MAAPANSLDPTLDQIVDYVRRHAAPELILLFGSRANGDAREDSDYDLLLVLSDDAPLDELARAVRDDLSAAGISADVLVRSAGQYVRQQKDPGLLDFMVARTGRLLHSAGRLPQRCPVESQVREDPPREGLEMWIRRADSDLRVAELSLAADDPVWDAIAFHAHACAEKSLKALIVRSGSFPPRTHDLQQLLAIVGLAGDGALVDGCRDLMHILSKSRYPEHPEPTPAEARAAVEAARLIRRATGL